MKEVIIKKAGTSKGVKMIIIITIIIIVIAKAIILGKEEEEIKMGDININI